MLQMIHCTSGLACASRPLALRLQRRPVIAGRAQESFAPERSFWRDMMVLTWSIRTYLTTIQTCMGPVGLQMHRLIPCLLCQVRGRGPHRAGTRGDLASRATADIAPTDEVASRVLAPFQDRSAARKARRAAAARRGRQGELALHLALRPRHPAVGHRQSCESILPCTKTLGPLPYRVPRCQGVFDACSLVYCIEILVVLEHIEVFSAKGVNP